ncbi:cytochrome P450 [Ganoderma sinense ZZ0214-1]|uniref:Cytochrome P450 n=1 Tax=Ganoderma sinense ZZ0214-1 TaxID=1077348 RepID=A0A2G8RMH8_9APHY|nr:cytochrome P450 [Ganoderma sinense ZZ0214-1]
MVLSSAVAPLCMLIVLVALNCLYWGTSCLRTTSIRDTLPPGPSSLPLIGNLLNIPKVSPWLAYRELSKRYGKIMSFKVFSQVLILVDDAEVAVELLEKRSSIYSSRPESPMVALVGWDWNFGLFPYGEQWRRFRRMFWQHFHPGVVSKHTPHLEKGAAMLLSRLSTDPTKLPDHIRYSIGVIVLPMTYGIRVSEENNKYLSLVEEGNSTGEHLISSTSILEFIPALAGLPTWLPGTSFLRTLERGRKTTLQMRTIPWNDTRHGLMEGAEYDPNNVAASMRKRLSRITDESAAEEEEIAKNVCATIYSAASDTTLSVLCGFIVAMALHPEAQKKAQAELDTVVGPNRLPELDDMDKLPYVNAVIKENLRWHTPTPLGLPHVTTLDDEYSGYMIPKGSVVLVNLWSIFHDEKNYPEPDKFMPERFLQDGNLKPSDTVEDPSRIAFGFGRRICPGRHLAESMVFIFVSYILHVFDITPSLDDNGHPVEITLGRSSGLVS